MDEHFWFGTGHATVESSGTDTPWSGEPSVFLVVFGTQAEWLAAAPGEGTLATTITTGGAEPDPFGPPSKEGAGL